ncbi:tyrosinase [Paractinoplanes deccanensis]|uniref:Tyrosinase n=1 Tax=Paractinoplanes deccanensis TaxID=113561 RepID=A0ABQ3YK86_9ACTN|nr:tyrosinase family protein [Actinoplanes deccanensis]GID80398.1 tyrosinase [Actinoplanes deccanensis]
MAVVRRSAATLTVAEKTAFINALRLFKRTSANGRNYNWYIDQHISFFARTSDNISHAHRSPSFFPWHRKYLQLLEFDLQTVSGDPNLFIPYWDWTGSASPFTADFLGSITNGSVSSGNFSPSWGWSLYRSSISTSYLQRRLGQNASRPTAATVSTVQGYSVYDQSPWDSTVSNSYRNRNEIELHNRVHNFVGGHMGTREAPNDPVFWLHHCNIDRLWWLWQGTRGIDTYQPRTGTTSGVVDNTETMRPFAGGSTPLSVSDIGPLAYSYA